MTFQKVDNISVSARQKEPYSKERAPNPPRKPTAVSHHPPGAWAHEFEALLSIRQTVLLQTDSEGTIRTISVCDPFGVSSLTGMLSGRSLAEVFDQEVYALVAAACRNARCSNRTEELGCLFLGPDRPHWQSILVNCTRHPRHKVCRFRIVLHDPAIRTRIQLRTREDCNSLDRAMALGRLGTWEADFRTGKVICSKRLLDIVQASEAPLSGQDLIWTIARGCYQGLFANACKSPTQSFEEDIQLWGSHGAPHIVHACTMGIAEERGLPSRMAGIIEDVTEQRTLESRARNQATLLASAEKLGTLGTWELDLQTGEAVWSAALFDILGLPKTGVSNQLGYLRNLHPEDRARVPQIVAHAICTSSDCEYTWRYRGSAGHWHIHRTLAVPVRNSRGVPTHLVGVVRDITEQTRVEQELHRLSQSLMRARDQERRALARELHESAGQSLAALKMTLANLHDALPAKEDAIRSLVESCRQLTDETVREIRTVSYLMHPPLLDESGLAPAVRWYARGFAERSKIKVSVDAAEDFGRLHTEIEMTAFRLIQEALTNVHRYSGSRTARIRLVREKKFVLIEIADAGCGLPPQIRSDSGRSDGVGIAGMRERVHELNGIFEIEIAPGRGTAVRAVFPERFQPPTNLHRRLIGGNRRESK